MKTSLLVILVLGTYALLSVALLIFLFLNRDSAETFSHSSVLLASLLPVCLAVLPLIKDERVLNQVEISIIYDQEQKIFLSRNRLNDNGLAMLFDNLGNLPADCQYDKDETTSGLNLIEKGLLSALFYECQNNWTKQINAMCLLPQDIASRFRHNKILNSQPKDNFEKEDLQRGSCLYPLLPGFLGGLLGQLFLPENSEILSVPEKSATKRSFKIKHHLATINFTVSHRSSRTLQKPEWWLTAVGFPGKFSNKRFYQMNFEVVVFLKTNRFRRFSPETELFRELHQKALAQVSKFHWPSVQQKLKTSLENEALIKLIRGTT